MSDIEVPKAENVSKEFAELAKSMEEKLIMHSEATFRDTVKALNALNLDVKETKSNLFKIAKRHDEANNKNKENLAQLQKDVELLMATVKSLEQKIAGMPNVVDTIQLLVKSVTGVNCSTGKAQN